MRIDVLTLFPQVFDGYLRSSIVARAIASGVVTVDCHDFREHAKDKHHSVDDRPFGGGPGMVLMCQPVLDAFEALEAGLAEKPLRVLLTPQGERLDQGIVAELADAPWLVLMCGHYEGFDERIRALSGAREISIGDYVLSGGEPAAMVLIDAVTRLLPGALGDERSARDDSFTDGLLEYPQYTRPREYRGLSVPEVLLSGDHGRIEEWRRSQARTRTSQRRPDLMGDGAD